MRAIFWPCDCEHACESQADCRHMQRPQFFFKKKDQWQDGKRICERVHERCVSDVSHAERGVPADICCSGDYAKSCERCELLAVQACEGIFSGAPALEKKSGGGEKCSYDAGYHAECSSRCLFRFAFQFSDMGQTWDEISVEECPDTRRAEKFQIIFFHLLPPFSKKLNANFAAPMTPELSPSSAGRIFTFSTRCLKPRMSISAFAVLRSVAPSFAIEPPTTITSGSQICAMFTNTRPRYPPTFLTSRRAARFSFSSNDPRSLTSRSTSLSYLYWL